MRLCDICQLEKAVFYRSLDRVVFCIECKYRREKIFPQTPPEVFKKLKGFALLSREETQACASKGGKLAQEKGTAHRFTKESGKRAAEKRDKSV